MRVPSAIKLAGYQKRWIRERSRFAIYKKARQIGITFATLLMLVLACVERRQRWYYLSAGERQAKEAIDEAQKHCDAIRTGVQVLDEPFRWQDREYFQLSILFPNGSRIAGLPANPATARGSHGNVVLDEFAHHKDAGAIWRALVGVITRGYQLRVLSSPAGKQGKFYGLWTHGDGLWKRHDTDIYQARDEGMVGIDGKPIDIEQLRRAVGSDPDDWAQEYEGKFTDEHHAWLPYELIDQAEDDDATLELPDYFIPTGQMWLGGDFGRTRGRTAFWLNEQLGDVHWMRALVVMHKAPFRMQVEMANALMPLVRRGAFDKGVFGGPLVEALQERWGTARVEGVQLTNTVKEDLATRLRIAFEDRRIRIAQDVELRRDLHSIKKLTTSAGNVRFDPEQNKQELERHGHADRFWAGALALHASSDAVRPFEPGDYSSVARSRFADADTLAMARSFMHADDDDADDDDDGAFRGWL